MTDDEITQRIDEVSWTPIYRDSDEHAPH